jgi:hypothetical protein
VTFDGQARRIPGPTCLMEQDSDCSASAPRARRRVMPRVLTSLLGLTLLGAVSAGALGDETQVYKSVDAQGNVVYSDRANGASTKKTAIAVHEPSPEDLKAAEQQRKAADAAETQRLQDTLNNRATAVQQNQQQKEKQARCDHAREYFYSLRDANRIYQRDAQGNPMYLSDDAADAKRAEARKAMDAACAG